MDDNYQSDYKKLELRVQLSGANPWFDSQHKNMWNGRAKYKTSSMGGEKGSYADMKSKR